MNSRARVIRRIIAAGAGAARDATHGQSLARRIATERARSTSCCKTCFPLHARTDRSEGRTASGYASPTAARARHRFPCCAVRQSGERGLLELMSATHVGNTTEEVAARTVSKPTSSPAAVWSSCVRGSSVSSGSARPGRGGFPGSSGRRMVTRERRPSRAFRRNPHRRRVPVRRRFAGDRELDAADRSLRLIVTGP